MNRLLYALVALMVLGLIPWALDRSHTFSATASSEKPGKSHADPAVVRSSSMRAQRTEDGAPPRGADPTYDATARAIAVPGGNNAAACCAGDNQTPSGGEFSFTATRGFGGVVTLTWHLAKETGFEYYLLDRKLASDPDAAFERNIGFKAIDGHGEYSTTDTPTPDTYTYRLRALAMNDSSDGGKTLGTADVAVDYVVGLAVSNFRLTTASDLVSVDWTSAQEAGVVNYVIDRKPTGAASYDLGVHVGYPQGEGTAYSAVDEPPGAGTFIYRLRAVLSNGTEKTLAEGDLKI